MSKFAKFYVEIPSNFWEISKTSGDYFCHIMYMRYLR